MKKIQLVARIAVITVLLLNGMVLTGKSHTVGHSHNAEIMSGTAANVNSPSSLTLDTWTSQTSGSTATLYCVSTVNADVAWVGSGSSAGTGGGPGVVLKTANGGSTWTSYTAGTFDIFAIKALDTNTCLIGVYTGSTTGIYKTVNGGTTWTQVYNVSGSFIDVIDMFDANNGYAIGDPVSNNWVLLKTTDGGNTWANAATLASTGTEAGWNNASYWIGNTGYFGTNASKIYKTTDRGVTWSATTTTSANSYALAFETVDIGVSGFATGVTNKTTNGGTNWSAATTVSTSNVMAMASPGPGEYFALCGSSVYKTTDLGTTWSIAYAPAATLYHISVVKSGITAAGYAVGPSGKIVKFLRNAVTPTVTLTAPNGGEKWFVGQSNSIIWTSSNITDVKLELTTNNGGAWTTLAATTPAAGGTYMWTVPNSPSTQCKIRVTDVSTPSVGDTSNNVFTISDSCGAVTAIAEWNMISVPRNAANMGTTALFPTATSPAYGYSNGYVTYTTLTSGKGYWLRFPSAQGIPVCGLVASATTIPVTSGWNMIGVYASPAVVANITTTPANILTSSFFGYNNGYQVPTVLTPGKGYWIRVSQDGAINIPAFQAQKTPQQSSIFEGKGWIKISAVDRSGRTGTIYASVNKTTDNLFDLPPLPPAGAFDIRFSTQKVAEQLSDGSAQFILSGADYPVTLEISGGSVRLYDAISGGRILNQGIDESGKVIIANSEITVLEIESLIIPGQFALLQNYPNPFNPKTTLKYSIAEQGRVSIKIYDVTGCEVAVLLDEIKNAGNYSVEWDAANYPSGVYFYELKEGMNRAVKKLILLK